VGIVQVAAEHVGYVGHELIVARTLR
jgi:hypothetical protein